jgi:hypothetical protein
VFYTQSLEFNVCEIRESWLVRNIGDHYEIAQYVKGDDKWHTIVTLKRKEGNTGTILSDLKRKTFTLNRIKTYFTLAISF